MTVNFPNLKVSFPCFKNTPFQVKIIKSTAKHHGKIYRNKGKTEKNK
jgi:hypothetical protein